MSLFYRLREWWRDRNLLVTGYKRNGQWYWKVPK